MPLGVPRTVVPEPLSLESCGADGVRRGAFAGQCAVLEYRPGGLSGAAVRLILAPSRIQSCFVYDDCLLLAVSSQPLHVSVVDDFGEVAALPLGSAAYVGDSAHSVGRALSVRTSGIRLHPTDFAVARLRSRLGQFGYRGDSIFGAKSEAIVIKRSCTEGLPESTGNRMDLILC